MKEELLKLISEKSPGSKPLYLVVRGSHAYGTNIETSDTDYAGVFIQSEEDILGNKYVEQINDDKNDIIIYEIRRFLELLGSNNPTVLELLNTPEDCVIYKDPIFDLVLNDREKFISKVCAKSLGGYAKQQISKAKGQNKKQNWEKDKVTRKEVLDFVYVIEGEKSTPWKVWNEEKKYEEKFIGVVNVPNARDIYAVYFDQHAEECFSEKYSEEKREENKIYHKEKYGYYGLSYKGLVKTNEGINSTESNALRLSSIPKDEKPICVVTYNKDGYMQHCKDYKSYETWLDQRNEQRWVDVESHGQKIDGKNMMHCRRLMDMAREIAEALPGYRIIVDKSTVPVKTGEKVAETIRRYGPKGVEFDVVSNPEFLREGFAIDDLMKPDRVVVGTSSERAAAKMREIYEPFRAPIIVTDANSAELIKHAANSFLALKISYANALSVICEASGANVQEVTRGMGLDAIMRRCVSVAQRGFDFADLVCLPIKKAARENEDPLCPPVRCLFGNGRGRGYTQCDALGCGQYDL